MNKKLLTLLLLLPVGFFLADKVLGINTPEGDKAKFEQPTKTAGCEAENTSNELPDFVQLSSLDNHQLKNLQAKALKVREEMEEDEAVARFHEADLFQGYSVELSEEFTALMDKQVVAPMQKADVFDLNLVDEFSRCSSGYHYNVIAAEDGTPSNKGYLVRDEGCWDRPFAIFQADLAANKVGIELPDGAGTVSVRDFLSLLKKA